MKSKVAIQKSGYIGGFAPVAVLGLLVVCLPKAKCVTIDPRR